MSSTAALAATAFAALQLLLAGLAFHDLAASGLSASADSAAEHTSGLAARRQRTATLAH